MDLNSVLAAAKKMFPSVNLSGAVEKAQEAISGTENSLSGVSAAARSMGLNAGAVNSIYSKYGNTMQARMLCKIMGTTPEALKADADRILGAPGGARPGSAPLNAPAHPKFPRLK